MRRHSIETRHYVGTIVLLITLIFPHAANARSLKTRNHLDDQCKQAFIDRDLEPWGGENCEIPGNGDFYGLGVRLGIYLTWISSWIANNFVAGEMGGGKSYH